MSSCSGRPAQSFPDFIRHITYFRKRGEALHSCIVPPNSVASPAMFREARPMNVKKHQEGDFFSLGEHSTCEFKSDQATDRIPSEKVRSLTDARPEIGEDTLGVRRKDLGEALTGRRIVQRDTIERIIGTEGLRERKEGQSASDDSFVPPGTSREADERWPHILSRLTQWDELRGGLLCRRLEVAGLRRIVRLWVPGPALPVRARTQKPPRRELGVGLPSGNAHQGRKNCHGFRPLVRGIAPTRDAALTGSSHRLSYSSARAESLDGLDGIASGS